MLSIIIPYFNEEENIPVLVDEINAVFRNKSNDFEIIIVDDGSQEQFKSTIPQLPHTFSYVHLLKHRKRLGKGEALRTGVRHAKGDLIVFMDGDLQDDPNDLKKFLQKIEEGADLVNGARIIRKDSFIIKIYSFFANRVLRGIFHSPFTDINCGFKMFKREVLEGFPLYGNNFRFFPLSAYYRGYVVDEVKVNNRRRLHGVSKFGPMKLFTGIIDMIGAYFVFVFAERPLHFFGLVGGVVFFIGFVISLYLAIERIFFNVMLYRRPMLQLGIVFIIVGIQIGMTGLIGELIVYLNKNKK